MGSELMKSALCDDDGLRELRLLYNHAEDDSRQFTRWQMVVAMNHGKRLARAPAQPAMVSEAMRKAGAKVLANLPELITHGQLVEAIYLAMTEARENGDASR
jgi:hypothetical protein